MRERSAAEVRAAIARHWLGESSPRVRMGDVDLRPHQIEAVERVRALMRRFGGALLADAVGLGKTYVALALAREAARPLVVAPAALRAMWEDAFRRTGVRAAWLSHESLSRAGAAEMGAAAVDAEPAAGLPDLVIVDEAHHARNPRTRRYAALASRTRHARVLLLSATPVHNRRSDLTALLALFLGERACAWSDRELARCIVRRDRRSACLAPIAGDAKAGVPRVLLGPPLVIPHDDGVLEALLALPPPVPPGDGGDGGALVAHGLVRRWASSRGALRASLRRRATLAAALAAALEDGRYPTRVELRSWIAGDDTVQLALPGMLATPGAGGDPRIAELLAAVHASERALQALLLRLERSPDPDGARAGLLLELARARPHMKIVAFSAFADTVRALWRLLRVAAGVAALTARGAVVAGGPITRAEALARFAPVASGVPPPPRAERITLLLTTDLLSEGVNLQDASVVVHLDLPWTPARLEQRVGRVARLGSPHESVEVLSLAPPAPAEALIAVERRLREKLAAARRSIGVAGAILPSLAAHHEDAPRSDVQHREQLRGMLRGWRAGISSGGGALEATIVAAVQAASPGFVAALTMGTEPFLIAGDGEGAGDAAEMVLGVAAMATGEQVPVRPEPLDRALDAIAQWCGGRRAAAAIGLGGAGVARRRVLTRIARIMSRARFHERGALAVLAANARRAASASLGAGAERVLGELAEATMPDEAWLRAVGAFGSTHAPEYMRSEVEAARIVALLVLQPPPASG